MEREAFSVIKQEAISVLRVGWLLFHFPCLFPLCRHGTLKARSQGKSEVLSTQNGPKGELNSISPAGHYNLTSANGYAK